MATINAGNFGTGALGTTLVGQGVGVAPIFQASSTLSRVNVTGATQAMAVNTAYTTNDAGSLVTYTLPATAAVGDTIKVIGNSASGWKIAQNAGQLINIQGIVTTTGVTGFVQSSTAFDTITLTCTVANTTWTGEPVGNIAYN